MPSTTARADWRSILLVAYSVLAMLFLLIAALVSGLSALMNMFYTTDTNDLGTLIFAGGLVFCATLLVPGAYYGVRRMLGRDESNLIVLKFKSYDWLIFFIGWPVALLASELLIKQKLSWIIAPFFTALSVLIPVYFLVKLGANGLPVGSRQRGWGILNTGIAFTPVIILIAEGLALVILLLVAAILLSAQPGAFVTLRQLAYQLQNLRTEEEALQLLLPYLTNPFTVVGLLSILSVAAPVIEESLKTIGIWLMGRRVHNPAEGFVLGLLCGAGFTIVETIGSSSSGTDAWSLAMLTRFGSDLVHIVNGGLMGWAIISAMQEKRYLRMAATLALVMIIHSLWNACTIFLSLGAVYLEIPGSPAWAWNGMAGGAAGLLALSVGMLIVLILSNRRLRATLPAPIESDSPLAATVIEMESQP